MNSSQVNPLYSAALQDHLLSKYKTSITTTTLSSPGKKCLSTRQRQLLRWSKSVKKSDKIIKKTVGFGAENVLNNIVSSGGVSSGGVSSGDVSSLLVFSKTDGFTEKYLDSTPSTLAQRLGKYRVSIYTV